MFEMETICSGLYSICISLHIFETCPCTQKANSACEMLFIFLQLYGLCSFVLQETFIGPPENEMAGGGANFFSSSFSNAPRSPHQTTLNALNLRFLL